jgi:hypothetical protein
VRAGVGDLAHPLEATGAALEQLGEGGVQRGIGRREVGDLLAGDHGRPTWPSRGSRCPEHLTVLLRRAAA